MHKPSQSHCQALKRILRYLQSTVSFGLRYTQIHGFSDSDWADDSDERRSKTGFAIFRDINVISWASRKQCTVSRSSIEAEYRALATTMSEIAWLGMLLTDIGIPM